MMRRVDVITHSEIQDLIGAEMLDSAGQVVGKIDQIYLDQTGQPEWAAVTTGFFGMNESVVPLAQAERAGKAVRVPYDKSTISHAPNIVTGGGHPDESHERELYVFYGLDYANQRSESGLPSGQALDTEQVSEQGHQKRIAAHGDIDPTKDQRIGGT